MMFPSRPQHVTAVIRRHHHLKKGGLMIARFAMSVGLLGLLLGHAFGQDKAASPGNPPHILIASEIDKEGNLVLVRYQTVFALPANPKVSGAAFNTRILEKVPLKNVKIYGLNGKEVTVDTARKMLGKDTPVLVSSWGRPLPPFYRKVFKNELLLFAFPKEAPSWKEIQEPEQPVK
jgi:hypothetical protein